MIAIAKLGLTLIFIWIIYRVQHAIVKSRERYAHARANGCVPPTAYLPSSLFLPFGLDKLINVLRSDAAKRFPPFMLAEFETHGHTYTQHAAGTFVVLTREPENIQALLGTRFRDFDLGGDRRGNFSALAGQGVFTQEGEAWAQSRALLRPQFAKAHIADLSSLELHVQRFISRAESDVAGTSASVDFQALFFSLTLDSSTEFLFGKSISALEREKIQDTGSGSLGPVDAFNTVLKWLAKRGRLGDFYWLAGGKQWRDCVRVLHRFVDELVQQALALRTTQGNADAGVEHKVFLNALLEQVQDVAAVRNHLLAILIAGRDTTASLLGWIFYLLARDTRVLGKLKGEIVGVLGEGNEMSEPSYEQLNKMKYLTQIINETLRIYPVAPLNGRVASRDTVLPVGGGSDGRSPIFVRQGAKCAYNLFALHRRQDFFGSDANEFRPERWDEEPTASSKAAGWRYLPFNLGPRSCMGQQLALVQAAYVTCRLVQHFKVIEADLEKHESLAGPSDPSTEYGLPDGVRYEVGLVMEPADGVWVRLK
ncbi:MAG: hypothetical protein M1839_000338 [Geoglossum umbratile]|nr:MAG: hypothetical protein M1839_000338 [Geoglossum umbratile]